MEIQIIRRLFSIKKSKVIFGEMTASPCNQESTYLQKFMKKFSCLNILKLSKNLVNLSLRK